MFYCFVSYCIRVFIKRYFLDNFWEHLFLIQTVYLARFQSTKEKDVCLISNVIGRPNEAFKIKAEIATESRTLKF